MKQATTLGKIPESRRKHRKKTNKKTFAQWNNHPQTKAETTHTTHKKAEYLKGEKILRSNIKIPQATNVNSWAESTY